MTHLAMIADRFLERPLLVTPEKAMIILSVLAGRIGISSPEASRFEGDDTVYDENGQPVRGDWGAKKKKPFKVSNGVGIVTITGSLVNRGAWIGANSGLTSYEGIGHQLKSVAADDAVHSVILDLHSPGGEATGAFETAAIVRNLAKSKRTIAVVNGMAASAAYAIASGASEIVTTETGVSGSIGVVLLHADFSRQLDRDGITPTLIHAGAHKVDGNPFEPLSEDVRGDLQAEVNAFYDAFLSTVAVGRGSRLTAAAARKTEAKTFIGKAAVDVGMADRVGTFESVLAELSRANGRKTVHQRRASMDNENQPAPAAGISQATHDAAVKTARNEGEAAGVKATTDKFAAVVSADGIKGNAGRMAAAIDLAIKSPGMSADDVTAFVVANVADAPKTASLPADRAQNAPGGLAVVDANAGKEPAPANDFEKGKQIAKSLGLSAR